MSQNHSIHRHQSHLTWNNAHKPVLTLPSNSTVTFDCIDGGNGQITPSSTAADILKFDVKLADPVFGPVYIEDAEPGDALEIEVLDLETANWGWTAIVPDFGLLQEEFPDPELKLWNLPTDGSGLASFNDRIKIPIRPFMGTMGVAPGEEGNFPTIPPLDTGGNIDCRHIVKGSRLILPVRTKGALFSCGDGHAAQGDGEVCGCAIETPMKVTLRFVVRKNWEWVRAPQFHNPPESSAESVLPDQGSYSTMGIDSDLLEATRKAVRAMIDYLHARKGLTKTEAYMLCSVAADVKLAEVVDMPNFAVTATIPLNIFVEDGTLFLVLMIHPKIPMQCNAICNAETLSQTLLT